MGRRSAGFFHGYAIAAGIVFDARHIGLDKRQAAAAGASQILVGRAVGDRLRFKPGALVGDSQPETFWAGFTFHEHSLRFVESIAVTDRVTQRFFEGHLNAEVIAAVWFPAKPFKFLEDFLQDTASAHPSDWAALFARSSSNRVPTFAQYSAIGKQC